MNSNYWKDIDRARTRVASGSKILETPVGPIEYAEAGKPDGPPVLVIHGAGGGFDQGLDMAQGLIERGFRVIAPSRFGYLRTPLPADASPAAQADAHAAVLDALDIPRCAVFGASAGGPSTMQLALRHPDRVTALVLMVPAAWAPHEGAMPRRMSKFASVLMDATLRSDFLFWLALRVAPRTMIRLIGGTPPDLLTYADPADRARVQLMLEHILPVSNRRLGLLNEARVVPNLPRFELERIEMPTLIISAGDDEYQTFAGSKYSAEHIPNARFIGYATGGHMLVGHERETTAAILDLLQRAPALESVGV